MSSDQPERGTHSSDTGQLVARNTLYLTVGQALTVPLSILINAMAAHYLGPTAFGYAYLANTLCAFGYLLVGWGHDAVLPAAIARDHGAAGRMLGSSLAWRIVTAVLVYLILALLCVLLGYPADLQWALALTAVVTTVTYLVAACKDTIIGLERTDIPAYAHVGQHLLATTLVCVVLVLGGQLRATLVAHAAAGVIVLLTLWRALGTAGVGPLSVEWATVKELLRRGTPFMALGIAMALQPNVDAVFLSKLAPPEVMGWFSVSRRLVGALLLPASALISALYPTLCRLHGADHDAFNRATRGALESVSLVVVPVALGCALFPEIGVALFSRELFRPAEDNLRILSVYVALVYFSMPLGTSIMAAGRQRAWSVVQCLCIGTSLALDPLLVPVFQRQFGNGGLGLCVAAVISEVIVIACGVVLAPRGLFDRRIGRLLLLVALSGGAMAAAGQAAKQVLSPYLAALIAIGVYVSVLWLVGALDRAKLNTIRAALGRRVPTTLPADSSTTT